MTRRPIPIFPLLILFLLLGLSACTQTPPETEEAEFSPAPTVEPSGQTLRIMADELRAPIFEALSEFLNSIEDGRRADI